MVTEQATLHPLDDPEEVSKIVGQTHEWVLRAVIGLNLCPFAKAAHVKNQIRYAATGASNGDELLEALIHELTLLDQSDPHVLDTTLLIHPRAMLDFMEFNAFLESAESIVDRMNLAGVLQVASFHPDFQFADATHDDITNYTNRSPYPTLHLLREESIDRAVEAFPDPEAIYGQNMKVLRTLGLKGWQALFPRT